MTVVISGSSGITYVNGSASSPSVTGSDTTTGMYYDTGIIGFSTNSTARLYIDSSGKVGVGTTSPGYKFDVYGVGRLTSGLVCSSNIGANPASSAGGVDYNPQTNDFRLWSFGAGQMLFLTNNAERMRIDSSGQVAIGSTTSAGVTLRVNKNLTGATTYQHIVSQGDIQSDVTVAARGFQTYLGTANASFTLPELTHYYVAQSTIGASSTVTSQYGFNCGNITGATNNYGFYSSIGSASGRWNFYAAGTAANYFAGNVGVGGPNYAFARGTTNIQAHGTSGGAVGLGAATWVASATNNPNIVLAKSRGTSIGTHTIVNSGDTLGQINFEGSDGSAFLQSASIFGYVDGTPTSGSVPGRIAFSTTASGSAGSVERMRIDQYGNVSIGTSSVFYPVVNRTSLSLNGTNQSLLAFGTGGFTRGYLYTDGGNLELAVASGQLILRNYAAQPIIFNVNNTIEAMRIDSTGAVGIGTSLVSQSKLTVGGSISTTLFDTDFTSGGARTFLDYDSINTIARVGGIAGGSASTPALSFWTNTTEKMRIDPSGNVSIGKTSTAYKFEVLQPLSAGTARFVNTGSSYATDVVIDYVPSGTTIGSIQLSARSNGDIWIKSGYATGSMLFLTGGTSERMRIDSVGRIGVGVSPLSYGMVSVGGNAIDNSFTASGFVSAPTVSATATVHGMGYISSVSTADAASVTPVIKSYFAEQGTITGGSRGTVTNQYGFYADSTLIGATNNYGFFSNIASGSNRWNFYANGTASNYFAGALGIGTNSLTARRLVVSGNVTGSAYGYGIVSSPTMQSDVTSGAWGFYSSVSTQAASFTVGEAAGFVADNGSIGAGSTVTKQYGFYATSALTNASSNYGFYSNIASGANRYNFYAAGTAENYFAGKVGIATTGTSLGLYIGNNGRLFDDGNFHIHATSADLWVNSEAGALNLQRQYDTNVYIGRNGNVGIGTGSISAKLDVYGGNVRVTGTNAPVITLNSIASGSYKSLINFQNSSVSKWEIGVDISATGNNNFYFYDNVASLERMRIDNGGNLLVGYTSSNGVYKLQVNSQIFATSATIATSDARYKKNVESIINGLSIVTALNPVAFDWEYHPVHNFDTTYKQVGFIAQEVQEVLETEPYLNSIIKANACELPDGTREEFLGIAEGNMIAILTAAIKELTVNFNNLKAEFEEYKRTH